MSIKKSVCIALFLTAVIFLAACNSEAVNEVNADILFDQKQHEGNLTIHFFHLIAPDRFEKTGESILITTPKGKTILIDAGKPVVGPLVNDYLNDLGIEKIDVVMPSHPHVDHIGGLLTLFNEKEVGEITQINLPLEESAVYEEYEKLIEEKGFAVSYAEEGDKIEIEQDVTLEILNPMKGLSADTYAFGQLSPGIVNDVSMVVKLTHKNKTFLFTGDIYHGVEDSLITKFGEVLDVDVVVAPHHGLGTSSSSEFIEATNPEITIIPSNVLFDVKVVESYKEQGSEVYVSKFDGNILLISNGEQIDIYREFEADEADVVEGTEE